MSARVALVSPPFVKDYMRNARCDFVSLSSSSWYPIWLGQAGSYLESRGNTTILMDSQLEGESTDQALDRIRAFGADVVAVYTGRLSEASDIAFANTVAAEGRTVVLIGPYTSQDPEALLSRAGEVRLAVKSEFDLPLAELCDGQDPASISNFLVKLPDGCVQANAPRPLYHTETLDTFPITSEYFHRQLDIYHYKTPSELHPFIDVMSGRGCAWGRCTFCLWVQTFVEGSVYNLRSIEHFMQEFEYIERFMPHVRSVMIQDDMLTNRRAADISEALLQRGSKLRWSCYAKPNSKLTRETLHLMRRSGCLNLHVGFESGDDAILAEIDKGTTVDQTREFAALAHEAGLHIHGDFAMGHFGDTRETMQKTLDLARAVNPHTAQFQIMIPFEGTRFWNKLQATGAVNSSGEPSYERLGGASASEIRSFAKHAYRRFYLSRSYLRKALADPANYLFNRFDEYVNAVPAMTWRRWIK